MHQLPALCSRFPYASWWVISMAYVHLDATKACNGPISSAPSDISERRIQAVQTQAAAAQDTFSYSHS
ncbi:hypothetical protein E2C01_032787 [Portunus trituberculatus]|uniref:Uncharacterized protein n=1 Tax=Portunus trituberculatus TaxID=210409 RepID=A0A5B7F1A9_PORTR|nr:hypothetical protein [Portunus trituberculatus]